MAGHAAGVDPQTLYQVTPEGTSSSLKVGEQGKLVVNIRPVAGAHVSEEAPLKVQLSSEHGMTLTKTLLTQKDSVGTKGPDERYANPRFEVPFTAKQPGPATVDAKVTFFVCTESLCQRQEKTLHLSVNVVP
jgi:hypothetical protein